MPRRLRVDHPGAWHHVMNRGIAKRPLFEAVRDARYFMACLARQSHSGLLEIHAFTLLTNHFHLLVRSPEGTLSIAMQRCQDAYARWFNRGRKRDGPLFRGRFTNREIDSDDYWATVLRYIDHNPVSAGLAEVPWEFPFGSAYHYSRSHRGPPWLHREEVETWVVGSRGGRMAPEDYRNFCSQDVPSGRKWVVERCLTSSGNRPTNGLESLLARGSPSDHSWMMFKTVLADGTRAGTPVLAPDSLSKVIRRCSEASPGRVFTLGRRRGSWWEILLAGSLRAACGLSHSEISSRTGFTHAVAQQRIGLFRDGVGESPELAMDAERVLREAWCLESALGRPSPSQDIHHTQPHTIGSGTVYPSTGSTRGPGPGGRASRGGGR